LTRTPTPTPDLKSPEPKSSTFSQTFPESRKAANFTKSINGITNSILPVSKASPPIGSPVLVSSGPTVRSSYPRILLAPPVKKRSKIGKEKIEKIRESESKLALLKEDQKKILEEEINVMKGDAQEFVRQEQSDLTKERNEKIREILLEIEKIVSDYAEKENYDVILNDRVLIYGNPAKNLTEKMLTILNAK